VLNPDSNISYRHISSDSRLPVATASVDFVYSFAVLYHLSREQLMLAFTEFERVMKHDALGAVHFALPATTERDEGSAPGRIRGPLAQYKPRYCSYSREDFAAQLAQARLAVRELRPVASVAAIDDELGSEYLAVFAKPVVP
jgi:hypothetical protein